MLYTLFLLFPLVANAQVEGIVAAEKAFAQTSVDKSTRTAFLEFFTDSTLAFNSGKPVYGRKDWEARAEGNGYLFWWPVCADVAASGDFGYTTGPAVFGPDRSTREAKGGLYYASVWKKNADGRWKVLADMGSATYDPSENLTSLDTHYSPRKSSKQNTAAIRLALFDKDRNYDDQLSRKHASFDATAFASYGRMHRRGVPPRHHTGRDQDFQRNVRIFLRTARG